MRKIKTFQSGRDTQDDACHGWSYNTKDLKKNGTVFCLKELVTHRVDIYNMLGSYEVFGQASRS